MKTIIVKGVAGLGNRIFTLANALEIASKANRSVLVDWSDGQIYPKGLDSFNTYFSARNASGITSNWGLYDFYFESARFKPFLRYLSKLNLCSSSSVWVKKESSAEIARKLPKFLFPPELNPLKREILYADFLPYRESHFVQEIRIRKEIEEKFLMELPRNISRLVGIHIRNSDKKPRHNIQHFLNSLPKKKEYFIATDSESVIQHCHELKLKFYCQSTLRLSHHHDKDLGGLHHLKLNEHDKISQFEAALKDMIALVNCAEFIGQSNSSFSRVVRLWRKPDLNSSYWS